MRYIFDIFNLVGIALVGFGAVRVLGVDLGVMLIGGLLIGVNFAVAVLAGRGK